MARVQQIGMESLAGSTFSELFKAAENWFTGYLTENV